MVLVMAMLTQARKNPVAQSHIQSYDANDDTLLAMPNNLETSNAGWDLHCSGTHFILIFGHLVHYMI